MSKVTFDFIGENFVVIGSGSGMGRQITVELAQAGAKVCAEWLFVMIGMR